MTPTPENILTLIEQGRLTKRFYSHCEEWCLDGRPFLRVGEVEIKSGGYTVDGGITTIKQRVEVLK